MGIDTNLSNEKVTQVRELASKLNFECKIFHHEISGKTTADAERALGLDRKHIIKCLLLKSETNGYIGAIVRGSDRLDFRALEAISGYKSLRMANEEDIKRELGFEIGGVPSIIFSDREIPTYVDENVLSLDYVVGSGGTPFHGMRFNPSQLTTKLDYTSCRISQTERKDKNG